MGFGYGHGMNRLDFGIDPAPGLDKGSIFPFFQHGDIRHFQILNRINQKVVDQCSCFLERVGLETQETVHYILGLICIHIWIHDQFFNFSSTKR